MGSSRATVGLLFSFRLFFPCSILLFLLLHKLLQFLDENAKKVERYKKHVESKIEKESEKELAKRRDAIANIGGSNKLAKKAVETAETWNYLHSLCVASANQRTHTKWLLPACSCFSVPARLGASAA